MGIKFPVDLKDVGAVAGFVLAVVGAVLIVRHIPMLPNSLKP